MFVAYRKCISAANVEPSTNTRNNSVQKHFYSVQNNYSQSSIGVQLKKCHVVVEKMVAVLPSDGAYSKMQESSDSEEGISSIETSPDFLSSAQLVHNVKQLLQILTQDESSSHLSSLDWVQTPIDILLELYLKQCHYTPVDPDLYTFSERLRENCKVLFLGYIGVTEAEKLFEENTVDDVLIRFVLEGQAEQE